jgi:cytochrome c oxidase subunit III
VATYIPTRPAGHVDHGHVDHGDVPPVPPLGGGDEGRSDGLPNYGARLRRARLGMILAIVTVSMVFVSLTSAYVVRRGLPTFDDNTRTYLRDWGSVQLPWLLLAINTAILVLSSLTMEGARRSIARRAALAPVQSIPGVSLGEERSFPWLGITVVLGLGFLVGQWMAWGELKARGFLVSTNPYGSFVYLLTGAHAVHLAGGVIALIWACAASLLRKPVEERRNAVDVTAWYWHFMLLLWVYIFVLLGLVR